IPEAIEAILIGQSRMEPKVAVLKPLSSAIVIGTGGPFGAEGPIIMTGGAIGSLIAQAFHLSPAERKTLLVAGAAAGMSAIFATPLAAVLLAVELLLFEWKPRSFIPVAIAVAVAWGLRRPLLGTGPLFPVAPHATLSEAALTGSLVLGLIAGFASVALTRLVYACEDLFRKVPLHFMWWPAIGGVVIGLGGLIEPRALGVGYDVIGQLLSGHLVGAFLIGFLIVKAVIWSIALGSGTSGGVLAPLLLMGGALGALGSQYVSVGDARSVGHDRNGRDHGRNNARPAHRRRVPRGAHP
ncbi:MAG: chloride channel protein, partial [Gemmatimonadota bacterium]